MQVGDVVSGIMFERGKVIGIGSAEKLLMYDESGALAEFLGTPGTNPSTPCIAVEFCDRTTAVYVASEVFGAQKLFNVSVTRMVEDEYLGVEAADHDDALRKVLAGEIDEYVQKDKLDEKYVGAYVSFDGDPDAPDFDYTLDDKGGIISKEQDEPQLSK